MTPIQGMLMNSISYEPVFVQVVFNQDLETLLLLLILDFSSFDIIEVNLSKVNHPLWNMIFSRFGSN